MAERPAGVPASGAAGPAVAGHTGPAGTATAQHAAAHGAGADRLLERVGGRLDTDAGAVAVLVLLVLLAFSPWWLGGRIIAPLDILHEVFAPWHDGDGDVAVRNHFTSDAVTQYIVYRRIAERSFALDGRIGWSELTGGGRPEYANTMALYGDWTMQLHRYFDFWTAWHVGLMAQLLIAGLGMYVLLRSQAIRPIVAVIGAVAFAASTSLSFTLYHRWQLAAFAWVPWLVAALLRWRQGHRSAWALVPVFVGLALMGASLQTAVFVLIVLLALWLGWLLEERRGPRAAARLTAHFVAWGLLGAGLAAFTLLPGALSWLDGLDLHGARSAPGFEHGPLQPVRGLIFIPLQALPSLLGSPSSIDLTKRFHADLAYIAFFGLLPTLIALRCIGWRGTPASVRLLMLAGLLLPLTPLVGALYHRVQLVFVFGGAWAFALWWQHADEPGRRALRRLAPVMAVGATVWLVASVALWLLEAQASALLQARVAQALDAGAGGQLAGFREWMLQRPERLVQELRIWQPAQLVVVAAAMLALYAVRLRAQLQLRAASLILLGAVVLELGSLSLRWHTAVDPVRYPPYPVTPDIAALQQAAHGGRVHLAATHAGAALFFPPNTLAMYDVATIEQFETVDVHGMWQHAGRPTDAAALGAFGVTHAVAPAGAAVAEGWRLLHAGGTFDIWVNDTPVPRYLPAAAGITAEAAIRAAQREAGAASGVRVLEATPARRLLEVPPGTGLVRVAENWAEGWQYRSGAGTWRPVETAADRSMLLRPSPAAGPTTVELRYRPARRTAGWRISGLAAALILCAAAFGATLRRRDVA